MAGRLIVALPLFVAILAYVANPGWMQWSSFESPAWLRWAGAGLGLLTVPTVHWVFRSIGSNVSETVLTKEHHELVTRGPYRWIRHPLYSVGIALILSIGLMAANWFILLLGLVALVTVRVVVVPREEGALIEAFGDEYRDYVRHTGGLVPRLSSPRGVPPTQR